MKHVTVFGNTESLSSIFLSNFQLLALTLEFPGVLLYFTLFTVIFLLQ